MFINLVNQEIRVVGYIHRILQDEEEAGIVERALRGIVQYADRTPGPYDDERVKHELAKEFCREFLYEHFCIVGKPASATKKVLALAASKARQLNKTS